MAKEAQIVISEAAKPTTIDHNHRLPFEAYAEELSEGAFGVVKKIAISPEYFEAKDGSKSTKVCWCTRYSGST